MTPSGRDGKLRRDHADPHNFRLHELKLMLRFLVIGVLNTAVGLGTIYACKYFLSLGDVPANAIGYSVGLINSFLWNRNWTFSHKGSIYRATGRFLLVFLCAYAANLGTLLLLSETWGVDSYLAHALATIPYTVLFYFGSRYYAFKSTC